MRGLIHIPEGRVVCALRWQRLCCAYERAVLREIPSEEGRPTASCLQAHPVACLSLLSALIGVRMQGESLKVDPFPINDRRDIEAGY